MKPALTAPATVPAGCLFRHVLATLCTGYTEEIWRINFALVLGLLSILPMFLASHAAPWALYRYLGGVFYPLLAWWLLYCGFGGLTRVETRQWGGLTLTLIIAAIGIAGALPLGILLAVQPCPWCVSCAWCLSNSGKACR